MSKKICLGNITGECLNPSKSFDYECPYCLREDGKDGNGLQIVELEKAEKVFTILKDKIEE
jgi:hypothetical protein